MRLKTSKAVVDYWNEVRGNRPAPTRAALKPGPISAFLPDLFILQWNDMRDVEFRLAGTRICTLFGQELRGQSFTRLWPDGERKGLSSLLIACAERQLPMTLEVSGCRADYEPLEFEMVLLPLDDEGGTSRIFGSLVPEASSTWQLLEPIESLALDKLDVIGVEPTLSPPSGVAGQPQATAGFGGMLRTFIPFGRKRLSYTSM